MAKQVYITKTAKFLPNDPVSNDEMEEYLGKINGKPSRGRRIVLRNNGIKRRFYALNKEGKRTHTNAELTALAIKRLFENDLQVLSDVDLLCCGTSSPDQMMPSHAVMVHGHLSEVGPIEVISPSGNCCSGMHALKYAFMSVSLGMAKSAVSAGSECLARVLHANSFSEEASKLDELGKNPYIAFEKEFLRWMLSDGASAAHISDQPNKEGISLKIDWIEGVSYAHELETCMYMGAEKLENGTLKSFKDYNPKEIIDQSILSMKQDVKLLSEHIIARGFDKLKELFATKNLDVNEIAYFLPHISSQFFQEKLSEQLVLRGMPIPDEKWYLNLKEMGNVGAASIYMMLDDLFQSGNLKVGEKLLLAVPESARFSYVFALLTVV